MMRKNPPVKYHNQAVTVACYITLVLNSITVINLTAIYRNILLQMTCRICSWSL